MLHAQAPPGKRILVSTRLLPGVVRQVLDVPAGRLAAVIGGWPEPALLESGPESGDASQFSILAAYPRLVWEATGESWSLHTDSGRCEHGLGDVLSNLAALLERYRLAQPEDRADAWLPPFQGGMIGFFGYDLAQKLERLPRRLPRDSRLPDIRMALYDTAVLVDSRTGSCELWSWDLTGEGRLAALERGQSWRRSIERSLDSPRAVRIRRSTFDDLTASLDRKSYLEKAVRVLDFIAAGDVFQVNLSQRFVAAGRPEPLDVYLRLKARSPAPYAAFLRFGDLAVASASPELFYQTHGRTIVTRPIKGTRPRGGTPEEDERLAQELRRSPKDRAELTMIVDLERNDLGRVCQYGSVAVVEAMKLESFAQVHHLVATVEGSIRTGAGPIDVVRAVFPGGSITGAPKIRAMEIIDELEVNQRGIYTGAIGYFSRGGTSAFNIVIRTILIEGNRASFQVGGGIVADSDPEAEYEETLVKGRGMRAVLSPHEHQD
jgi:para-aminobenzoate synthetase component I